MARQFAKKFYHSKEWQGIRNNILKRDKYLCRMCGSPAEEVHHKEWLTPENINDKKISSGEDNLISVCRDCHFKIHRQAKVAAVIKKNKKDDVSEEYFFDANGYLQKNNTPPIKK